MSDWGRYAFHFVIFFLKNKQNNLFSLYVNAFELVNPNNGNKYDFHYNCIYNTSVKIHITFSISYIYSSPIKIFLK